MDEENVDALTAKEEAQVKLVFQIIWGVVTGIMIAAVWVQVVAGFKGWAWYIFIPVGGLIWFVLQFLKRHFRNLIDNFDAVASDTDEDITPTGVTGSESETETPDRNINLSQILMIAIVFVVVSAFWYGAGKLSGVIYGFYAV